MDWRRPPPHTGPLANAVEDSFELAVEMRCGFGVGLDRLDHHRAGPQFVRARSYVRDGGGAGYAGGWVCVGLQVAGQNDLDAVVLPVHDLYDNRNLVGVGRSVPLSPLSDRTKLRHTFTDRFSAQARR